MTFAHREQHSFYGKLVSLYTYGRNLVRGTVVCVRVGGAHLRTYASRRNVAPPQLQERAGVPLFIFPSPEYYGLCEVGALRRLGEIFRILPYCALART